MVVVVVVAVVALGSRGSSSSSRSSSSSSRSSSSSSSRHGSDSLEVSRWLPNRLRASTFVSRGPDQAPFPNDYGFSLSTAKPCATECREDV